MNKPKLNSNFYWFFETTDYFLELIEKILNAKDVFWDKYGTYKKELIKALLITYLTEWETFIKTLLVDCFNKDTSKYSNYVWRKIPKHITKNTCFCILSWIWFFDFKWIYDAKAFSKKIINNEYNPFLIKSDKVTECCKKIEEYYIIRNFITHWSMKSYNSYVKILKENYKYKISIDVWNFLIKKLPDWSYRIKDYIDHFYGLAEEFIIFMKERWLISNEEFNKYYNIL